MFNQKQTVGGAKELLALGYMFPCIVDSSFDEPIRMEIVKPAELYNKEVYKDSNIVYFLQESGVPGLVYRHKPTYVFAFSDGSVIVLDQNGNEMPKW